MSNVKKLNIYCLYDIVSKEQMPIFQMSSDEVAKRNVVKLNIKGTIEFPDDLHLVRLGYVELDDDIFKYELISDYKDLGSISYLTSEYTNALNDIQGVKPNERS